jgi:hypothetical protein
MAQTEGEVEDEVIEVAVAGQEVDDSKADSAMARHLLGRKKLLL